MRRFFVLLLASALTPAFAAPVEFSTTRDLGKGTVVVHGDSAEFSQADHFIFQAKFAEACTLEKVGDAVALTGSFEVKGDVGRDGWNLRLSLLTAPPKSDGAWLGYTVMPGRDATFSLSRREGGSKASGTYVSYTLASPLTFTAESPAKLVRRPGLYLFKLMLTRVTNGLDCRLELTDGESPALAFSGNDPAPKTFRFDHAGFLVSCPKAEKLKLGNVDASFLAAGGASSAGTAAGVSDTVSAEASGNSRTGIIVAAVAGAVLLIAGAVAVILRRRGRPAQAVVVPPPVQSYGRPPARPSVSRPGASSLPPPPGAE